MKTFGVFSFQDFHVSVAESKIPNFFHPVTVVTMHPCVKTILNVWQSNKGMWRIIGNKNHSNKIACT